MKIRITSLAPETRKLRSKQVIERDIFGEINLADSALSSLGFLIKDGMRI